jgi:acyl-CoA dehydrogenase
MSEEIAVALEFGRTTPAFRSVFGTNVGIGSQGLVMAGSEEQKGRWLPGIASGEIVTSFCLTEPGAGSDGASVQTRAALEDGVYKLSGSKRFITNADKASLFTVMARTGGEGASGVSAFLVPADRRTEWEAIVERCAARLVPRACNVTLTGPWPPYNFIAEVPSEAE